MRASLRRLLQSSAVESATNSPTSGDETDFSSQLAKKGPLLLLEAVIDVFRRQSDLFKDPTAVAMIAALASTLFSSLAHLSTPPKVLSGSSRTNGTEPSNMGACNSESLFDPKEPVSTTTTNSPNSF